MAVNLILCNHLIQADFLTRLFDLGIVHYKGRDVGINMLPGKVILHKTGFTLRNEMSTFETQHIIYFLY